MLSTVKACGVEILDSEREVWERQERERRGMFAEDEVKNDLWYRCLSSRTRELDKLGVRDAPVDCRYSLKNIFTLPGTETLSDVRMHLGPIFVFPSRTFRSRKSPLEPQ